MKKKSKAKEGQVPPAESRANVLEAPPPYVLLQEARQESNRRLLFDYMDTIRVLREEKGFSFREIGNWLTERGIEADYNDVYRAYTKEMSEGEKHKFEQQIEEENERERT